MAGQPALSTRFLISRVRLDVDYGNMNAPMMGGRGSGSQSEMCDRSKVSMYSLLHVILDAVSALR